jgi:glycine cleavage system H protein
MSYPSQLKYTKEHEWAKIEGNTVTVGITDHAQSALGDVVFLDLPKVGTEYKKGATFGVVESIKAVSDLYSPLTGKVLDVNTALVQEPSLVNRDPHQGAWMVKFQVTDPSTLDGLMDSTSYEKFISNL